MTNLAFIFQNSNPEEVADRVSDYCNGSCNPAIFYNALQEQEDCIKELWRGISLMWVLKLHTLHNNGNFDLRNEEAVTVGKQLYEILEKDIGNLYRFLKCENVIANCVDKKPLFELAFIDKIGRDHRTIQQVFSTIIFFILEEIYKERVTSVCGKDFWVLSYI